MGVTGNHTYLDTNVNLQLQNNALSKAIWSRKLLITSLMQSGPRNVMRVSKANQRLKGIRQGTVQSLLVTIREYHTKFSFS